MSIQVSKPIIEIQDDHKFFSTDGDTWFKLDHSPYGKTFVYYRCKVCGRLISNAGFANYSHMQMHLRKGEVDSAYKPTGKEPS